MLKLESIWWLGQALQCRRTDGRCQRQRGFGRRSEPESIRLSRNRPGLRVALRQRHSIKPPLDGSRISKRRYCMLYRSLIVSILILPLLAVAATAAAKAQEKDEAREQCTAYQKELAALDTPALRDRL